MNPSIWFHSEGISYTLRNKRDVRVWITEVIRREKQTCEAINFIFCNDAHLLGINRAYLDHDTYTDIITFDYTENCAISGDIFISVDRTRENAKKFGTGARDELHRVMVHGVLHLLGYKDKTDAEKQQMRNLEEKCLSLRDF